MIAAKNTAPFVASNSTQQGFTPKLFHFKDCNHRRSVRGGVDLKDCSASDRLEFLATFFFKKKGRKENKHPVGHSNPRWQSLFVPLFFQACPSVAKRRREKKLE
jgi:hypothetical protein